MRLFLKKCYLWLNDKAIKTRFFFDGEYARWKKFNEKGRMSNNFIDTKSGKEQKIYYLVPGVKISGGIAVILHHANELLKRGYDAGILSLNNVNNTDWFPNQKVKIFPYRETKKILKSGDINILIATGYSTAFTVDMAKARRKLYFVQSDESRFFPEDKNLCEKIRETYALPMEYLTMAHWIQDWLKKEFGHDSAYVPNGIDLSIFKKAEPLELKVRRLRVLIEGAINIPYKGMEDAYSTVKNLDCELWIVSNNGKPKKGWKYDKFFENVPLSQMPKIYSSCDILLKMSKVESFCYPPLEMMACGGVSVIRKVTGIEEYAVDGDNCLIVEDIQSAKNAVQKLIDDKKLREKLIESGYKTAREWEWDQSIGLLEKFINSR